MINIIKLLWVESGKLRNWQIEFNVFDNCLKNGQISACFLIHFRLFKHTLQILQQICMWKDFPSSIQCRDSNSRPLEHESPPITTRPVLPPMCNLLPITKAKKSFSYLCQKMPTMCVASSRYITEAALSESDVKELKSKCCKRDGRFPGLDSLKRSILVN